MTVYVHKIFQNWLPAIVYIRRIRKVAIHKNLCTQSINEVANVQIFHHILSYRSIRKLQRYKLQLFYPLLCL